MMKTKLFSLALFLMGGLSAMASPEAAIDAASSTTTSAIQQPKIAIVSIYCNKEIATGDFTGMGSMITQLANSEDFNLQPMVTEIHSRVWSKYTENLEYDFIPEETVLNNPEYNKEIFNATSWSGDYHTRDAWFLRPDGYLPISTNPGKKTFVEIAKRFPDADGFAVISISYELEKQSEIMGFGTAKMKAIGTIRIVNREGKKLFKVVQYASSKGKIKFALGGVFETAELMPLTEEATQLLFEKLDTRIIKKNKRKKK